MYACMHVRTYVCTYVCMYVIRAYGKMGHMGPDEALM